MAINTSLLICAPMLQDYLVDKNTGLPLSGGIITMYKDNSRTELKNWYYQTGVAGAYSYLPLPNPMVLSAVGTTVDVNGNDTLPFYYPYSEVDNTTLEPYYVTITDFSGNVQEIRQNFPFLGENGNLNNGPYTNQNYIINNRFWRNAGSVTLTNITSTLESMQCLCPSQHDGFSMPDFQFFKSETGSVETCTFTKFPLGGIAGFKGDIAPEYYLNHTCTAAVAEEYKYYQFPISLHVNTLDSVKATVTIQALNGAGNSNNTITLSLLQFTGTNAGSAPITKVIGQFNAPTAWKKFSFPLTTPNTQGLNLSAVADDALYLQIGIPAGVTTDINFCLPSFYISPSTEVPINDFATYDEIDAIINSPRTGDKRTSINSFAPYGWVAANNGTIGSSSSSATALASTDTWPLFNLLWNNTQNTWCQLVDNGGSPIARGASAYADFIAANAIYLPSSYGLVSQGASSFTAFTFTATIATPPTPEPISGVPTLNAGVPVIFYNSGGSLPAPLVDNQIYYLGAVSSGNAYVYDGVTDAVAGTTANAILFTSTGSGTNYCAPALAAQAGSSFTTEVVDHVHPFTTDQQVLYSTPGSTLAEPGSQQFGVDYATGTTDVNTGGVDKMGLLQPTITEYVFYKL